jgi:hypothetical protein
VAGHHLGQFGSEEHDEAGVIHPYHERHEGTGRAKRSADTGTTHIPAGWYDCVLVCGELVTTKKGKPAYRLALDVSNGPHLCFRLWRYFTWENTANANRSKAALGPFGLKTSADLRKPFPGPGRTITLRVLVTVQDRPDATKGNNIERLEVVEDKTATTSPNSVNPDDFAGAVEGTS